MSDLKEEMKDFMISLWFYLYTDGDEGGMSKNDRAEAWRKILKFSDNNKEWMETNCLFNLRIFNVSKYLGILLNPNWRRKYLEEVILERDIDDLRVFPIQELLYRTHKLRKSMRSVEGELITAFTTLVERLREIFRYVKKNPDDAKAIFAILIVLFREIDQVCDDKEYLKSDIESAPRTDWLRENYNKIENEDSKKVLLKLIDRVKSDFSNLIAQLIE